MKRMTFSRRMTLFLLAALMILSCSISTSQIATVPPQPTNTEEILARPTDTETAQPESTPTSTSEAIQEPTATSAEATCTVLRNLNLRFGPGTAYRPPIRELPANSLLTPLGFAPQGIPGGTWAYVQDRTTQDKGWVSAGADFIFCDIDLNTLPAVPFGTPPPPPLPRGTQTTDPDGNGFCIDPDSGITCVGTFTDESLFEFKMIQNGVELGENDGVEDVTFNVKRDDETIYSNVEENRAYCVFGGNGPCNPWVVENNVFKWEPDGARAEPGEYEMEVFATLNGEQSRWAVNFTLTLP